MDPITRPLPNPSRHLQLVGRDRGSSLSPARPSAGHRSPVTVQGSLVGGQWPVTGGVLRPGVVTRVSAQRGWTPPFDGAR